MSNGRQAGKGEEVALEAAAIGALWALVLVGFMVYGILFRIYEVLREQATKYLKKEEEQEP